MSDWIIVRPAKPGMGLRDPQTKQALPDDGASVRDTAHWRRLIDHELVEQLSEEEWHAAAEAKVDAAERSAAAAKPKAQAAAKKKKAAAAAKKGR